MPDSLSSAPDTPPGSTTDTTDTTGTTTTGHTTGTTALPAAPRDRWTVRTTTGLVKGHAATGVTAFSGIPYAEPPTGDLRFRRAVPKTPWSGVFHADRPGDYCAQFRNRRLGWIGSEDCLWLNVVVPRPDPRGPAVDPSARRPVVVYLHGGGNVHGSAGEPLLTGEHFATAMDAVYVAVNYRLGVLGQLSLAHAEPSSMMPDPSRADTNVGLSDIVTAVEWVHANAEVFGGDPSRITVMGESSGGAMVSALTAVPRVRPLLAGAISQSPAAAMVHTPDLAAYWCRRAAHHWAELAAAPSGPGRGQVRAGEALVDTSPEALSRLTEALSRDNLSAAHDLAGPFAPVVDGDLLPAHPLAPGAQTGLPLLTGTNRHEYLLMRWEPATTAHQRARARRLAAAIDGSVSTDLFDRFYARGRTRRRCAMFMSDAIFTAPTRRLASVQPDGAAWMYRLDLETPSLRATGVRAIHALDLPVLFERYDAGRGPLALALGGREAMVRTTAVMQPRWRAFIHDGDPGFPRWSEDHTVQVFGAVEGGRAGDPAEFTVPDPDPELRRAWDAVDLLP
ncbi:carboxylesterase family protein [Corynebacterium bovis]|uniref:carboxylesterase family protein n=1 Tax=Corynebacterium bovis TaxID=36808 RepID=UPI0021AB2C0B|nr:carboxylesterase family protein [Corynebacterium bovis]